jgi:hypothetical protein
LFFFLFIIIENPSLFVKCLAFDFSNTFTPFVWRPILILPTSNLTFPLGMPSLSLPSISFDWTPSLLSLFNISFAFYYSFFLWLLSIHPFPLVVTNNG